MGEIYNNGRRIRIKAHVKKNLIIPSKQASVLYLSLNDLSFGTDKQVYVHNLNQLFVKQKFTLRLQFLYLFCSFIIACTNRKLFVMFTYKMLHVLLNITQFVVLSLDDLSCVLSQTNRIKKLSKTGKQPNRPSGYDCSIF